MTKEKCEMKKDGEEEKYERIGERQRGDAVMRSVAVATSGAGLCWALIYIIPHERRRERKQEMEEKRERDRES